MSIRVATRSSALARTQAGTVAGMIGPEAELVTVGADPAPADGDKERFVRGVERLILDGGAEAGVHSAKDLPGRMAAGLTIAAVPERADPRDAWIGAGGSIEEIPEGARVGTVSPRRRAQLLAARPDLVPVELRGNVDTRIRKLRDGEADGIVLAVAGLERLGRADEIGFVFDPAVMTPAAGQGALVLQSRADWDGRERVSRVDDDRSHRELLAERAAVVALEGDCHSPIGIHARHQDGRLTIDGFAGSVDGSAWIRDRVEGDPGSPEELGRELAARMLVAGAAAVMSGAAPGR